MRRVVIIGGGFGGIAAGIELAKAGFDVTILEAHIYPGGCAGTFFHQGYKFDSGATLAGGFGRGAPMALIGERYSINWEVRPTSRAMVVHLSDGSSITRWCDHEKWSQERVTHFGRDSDGFWNWQERTADVLWDLAFRLPPWPPQTPFEITEMLDTGTSWLIDNRKRTGISDYPTLLLDLTRPVSHHMQGSNKRMKEFVDAQLLISSQATSRKTNSLYGSVALDLPRQGVVEVHGGMGSLAEKFLEKILTYGGRVYYRQEAARISRTADFTYIVHTKRKHEFPADILIFNLPPWNIHQIAADISLRKFEKLGSLPEDAWGAFMVYVGLKEDRVPAGIANHHQVISGDTLGEGNSIFMSLSPDWDSSRAPEGYRALTISTHTRLREWWQLFERDEYLYEERKNCYLRKILKNASRVLPGIQDSAHLILPGTPITFQRFTRRSRGWVGGFPQTSLFRVWGPRLSRDIWMVGDTIFPGQSMPAVSMGGIRVAQSILAETKTKRTYNLRKGLAEGR